MQQEHQTDDLITVAEAAQRTGRPYQTIYGWIKKGEIKSCRIKKKCFVSFQEVKTWHEAVSVQEDRWDEEESRLLRHHQMAMINCVHILKEYDRKNRKYYDFDRYPVA